VLGSLLEFWWNLLGYKYRGCSSRLELGLDLIKMENPDFPIILPHIFPYLGDYWSKIFYGIFLEFLEKR
jgi:hypothetical protein